MFIRYFILNFFRSDKDLVRVGGTAAAVVAFLWTTAVVVVVVEVEGFLDVFLPTPLEQLVTTLEL